MAAELKIGIGADTTGLFQGISDALSKITNFSKEVEKSFKKIDTSEIQSVISKLNSKIMTVDGNVQIFGDSLASSRNALNAYQSAFDELVSKGMDPASEELKTITEEIKRLSGVVSLADNGINSFKGRMAELSESVTRAGTALSVGLTAPIVGFVTASLWANKETKAAFDSMKTSISTSMGRIGKVIDETLHISEGFKKIAGFVKDLATAFQNLDPNIQKTILVIAGVAAAAGPLLLAVGKFIQFIPLMVSGIGGITKAFTFLLGPIGLVTIGIIAIVTAIVTNWSKITPYLVRTANNFIELYNESQTFRGGILSIGFAFESLYVIIKSFVKSAWNAFLGFGKGVLNLFEGISIMIRGAFAKDPAMIAEGWKKANQKVVFSFDDIGKAISGVENKYNNLLNSPKKLKLLTDADLNFNFKLGEGGFEKLATDVKDKANASLKDVKIELGDPGALKTALQGFVFDDPLDSIFTPEKQNDLLERMYSLPAKLNTAWEPTKLAFENAKLFFQDWTQDFNQQFRDLAESAIGESITDLFGSIGQAIGEGGNVIGAIGQSVLNSISGFLSQLGGMMVKFGLAAVLYGKLEAVLAAAPDPASKIAAGLGMIAAGAMLSLAGGAIRGLAGGNGGGSGSVPSGGGNSSQSYSSSFSGGSSGGPIELRAIISGQDLLLVTDRARERNTRLGG